MYAHRITLTTISIFDPSLYTVLLFLFDNINLQVNWQRFICFTYSTQNNTHFINIVLIRVNSNVLIDSSTEEFYLFDSFFFFRYR